MPASGCNCLARFGGRQDFLRRRGRHAQGGGANGFDGCVDYGGALLTETCMQAFLSSSSTPLVDDAVVWQARAISTAGKCAPGSISVTRLEQGKQAFEADLIWSHGTCAALLS